MIEHRDMLSDITIVSSDKLRHIEVFKTETSVFYTHLIGNNVRYKSFLLSRDECCVITKL